MSVREWPPENVFFGGRFAPTNRLDVDAVQRGPWRVSIIMKPQSAYTGLAQGKGGLMSDQQLQGVVILLLGVAALIISAGMAWTLSRLSRTRRVESAAFITAVSFLLLIVGVVLCYFGVSNLIEGAA
jgi:hypothetical protein